MIFISHESKKRKGMYYFYQTFTAYLSVNWVLVNTHVLLFFFVQKGGLNESENWQVFTYLFMAFPKELHFRCVGVFFCPLFSENRLKELALIHVPIQCHDSRALRCRQFAVVWLTVDHRTAQRGKWDTPKYPGESGDKTEGFFDIKLLFLSAGKWHIWVTHLLLDINTAGCYVCCDPVSGKDAHAGTHTVHQLSC